jgi:hypothetical protein
MALTATPGRMHDWDMTKPAILASLLLLACETPKPSVPPDTAKPRKYSGAEVCYGQCFPLVVSRFVPGTGVCECQSREAHGAAR